MDIAKLTFILIALVSFPFVASAEAETPLDSLYTDPQTPMREPASSEQTNDPDFVVTPPERAPASTAANSTHAKGSRRSRLPPSVVNGFELRVQFKNLNSMFWVVERNGRYDLVYANSSGSKSSLSLSRPSFNQLKKVAGGLRPVEENISKCKNASLQLHIVEPKLKERTVTTCHDSKSATAKQLLNFSGQLAALVR